jgi:hypothetical protein
MTADEVDFDEKNKIKEKAETLDWQPLVSKIELCFYRDVWKLPNQLTKMSSQ